jgi:hypothetical protein
MTPTVEVSLQIPFLHANITDSEQWSPKTASWERIGPDVMMVPHTSAIYVGPNEKAYDHLSIDADHSEIVKFSDLSNPDYLIVESRIGKLATQAPTVIKGRFVRYKKSE